MKNNINKFLSVVANIKESIKELADLYYQDLQNNPKAESQYIEKTYFTRTMLRRLVAIAKEDLLPDSFFIGNATAYRMLTTMSKDQQEKVLHDTVSVVAGDGSRWRKKFEDLSPRQMNMVYDQRAKCLRSEEAQKEWLNANPVERVSHKGGLKPIESKKPEVKKDKKPTKASLIKQLKEIGICPNDLAKMADASQLMEAAQIALKVNI